MKRWLAGLFGLLSTSAFAQSTSAPELQFDSVPNFIKLPPDMHLGEASGVATNSKGNIYVYSRGGTVANAFGATASQILEFDHDGGFIREVGKNLYAWAFAHTVRIDKDDNIWATDKGSDMIVKMSPEGRVLMVFGRKTESSDRDAHPHERPNPPLPAIDGRFRQPTDVAWDTAGNAYITDGGTQTPGAPWAICITPGPNQVMFISDAFPGRVYKLSLDGKVLGWMGRSGKQLKQFGWVHQIACPSENEIYVAEILTWRVQKLLIRSDQRAAR